MKSMPIAIICAPGTGSSVLANAFRLCGMQVGNENTYWHSDFDHHCEQSVLTKCGSRLQVGQRTQTTFNDEDVVWKKWLNQLDLADDDFVMRCIREILQAYINEAERNEWSHFGVKITTALSSLVWPTFRDAFLEVWPGCQFVSTIRHPFERVKYYHVNVEQECLDRWLDRIPAWRELHRLGAIFLFFPQCWYTGDARGAVETCGLRWNDDAEVLYEDYKVHKLTEADISNFEIKYPLIETKYKELLEEVFQ